MDTDELAEKSRVEIADLLSDLTLLELKGYLARDVNGALSRTLCQMIRRD